MSSGETQTDSAIAVNPCVVTKIAQRRWAERNTKLTQNTNKHFVAPSIVSRWGPSREFRATEHAFAHIVNAHYRIRFCTYYLLFNIIIAISYRTGAACLRSETRFDRVDRVSRGPCVGTTRATGDGRSVRADISRPVARDTCENNVETVA